MYDSELKLAKEAAIKAGNLLSNQENVIVDLIDGKDIKLALDRASEEIIVNCLKKSEIPILSEESGIIGDCDNVNNGLFWIVDPMDGSANYWKGLKELTCVSIALWQDGKPVLGVVNRFQCNELYVGVVGEGAWLNGESIHVSSIIDVSAAILATGFPVKRNYETQNLELFIKQVQSFKKIRMIGSAALSGVFVASGHIDAYIEEDIMLWDIAASSAIVIAAGGDVSIVLKDDWKCECRIFSGSNLKTSYDGYDKKI